MPPFAEIEDDFLRITAAIAWATVATVDTRGRPRTRVLHPIWEVVDGRPVGWIGTERSPLKTRHLEANPHVSASYWSPDQERVHAECRAAWADQESERVWQLFLDADPPLGYDPAIIPAWSGGPSPDVLTVLAPLGQGCDDLFVYRANNSSNAPTGQPLPQPIRPRRPCSAGPSGAHPKRGRPAAPLRPARGRPSRSSPTGAGPA